MRSWTLLCLGAAIAASFFACAVHDPEDETTDNSTGSGGAASTGIANGAAGPAGTGGSGATPGVVGCGTESCEVPAQKCCPTSNTCIPSSDSCPTTPCAFYCDGADHGVYAEISCDDAGDCADGQVCCTQDAAEPGYVALACGAAPCDYYEVCQPGGSCADGQACVASKIEATGAKCTGGSAQVPCGEGLCEGGSPVCCADDDSCVGYDDLVCLAEYECNGASDCGAGYSCCVTAGGASCSHTCVTVLCDTAADCPESAPSCAEDPAAPHPPGFKTCQ